MALGREVEGRRRPSAQEAHGLRHHPHGFLRSLVTKSAGSSIADDAERPA